MGILLFGKYLEPIWGSQEFLRFILIVNAITGLATFFALVALFALFENEALLYVFPPIIHLRCD